MDVSVNKIRRKMTLLILTADHNKRPNAGDLLSTLEAEYEQTVRD